MRTYVRPKNLVDNGQTLQLWHEGRRYRLVLEHTTVGEVSSLQNSHEHFHPLYHLVLYNSAANEFRWQGQRRHCEAGTLSLTSPNEPHSFSPCLPGQVIYSEMTFSYLDDAGNPLLLPFPEMLSLHLGQPANFCGDLPLQLTPLQAKELDGLVKKGLDWLEAGGALALLRWRNIAAAIWEFLLRECCNQAGESGHSAGVALRRVRAYIEQHYAEHLTVAKLAEMANFSVGYFLRAYHKSFDISPLAHQQRLRVEAAQTLLRTTELRGKEIAARVGFGDEYRFSKVFRQVAGITPTQYRRQRSA